MKHKIEILLNYSSEDYERIVLMDGVEKYRDKRLMSVSFPEDTDPIRYLEMFLLGEKPQCRGNHEFNSDPGIIPYEFIEGKAVPVPKALIQLAISKARNSDISDSGLADLIEDYLYCFMVKSGLSILTEERYDDARLSFKPLKQD